MKDTDKVTLTIGQLKKLVKESFNEDYEDYEETIRYNDILDELSDFSLNELKNIITDPDKLEKIENSIIDFRPNSWNEDNLQKAIRSTIRRILSGTSIRKLRSIIGRDQI